MVSIHPNSNLSSPLFHYRGFTLIEVMVTMILLGAVASLAFAQYTKVVEDARCFNAQMNVISMHNAFAIKKIRLGDNFTFVAGNLADINNQLGLSIVDANFTYVVRFSSEIAAQRIGPRYYRVSVTLGQPLNGNSNPNFSAAADFSLPIDGLCGNRVIRN